MNRLFFIKKAVAVVFCLATSYGAFAQDRAYATEILETLTKPEFHGRGYVNQGDKIAADYLANEFKKLGIQPFGENYFQPFEIAGVNTFPGKVEVIIGTDVVEGSLSPGIDYLVEVNSGSVKGTFKPYWIDKDTEFGYETTTLMHSEAFHKAHVLVMDPRGIDEKRKLDNFNRIQYQMAASMPVIVLTDKKLSWGVGRQELAKPIIQMRIEALPKSIEHVYLNIENKFIESHATQNVIGYIPGTHKKKKKEFVVFTGHYDHLGRMGQQTYFPGANDNGSGIGVLMSLAKHYAQNPPPYSVVFMCFAGEEAGLVGSQYYVANPLFDLESIRFLLNLDLMGTGETGCTVVNGKVHEAEFETLQKLNEKGNYLEKVGKRGKAANSDHYPFSERGVPAFFIYTTGGVSYYHDPLDRAETLPYTKYEAVFNLLLDFVEKL